MKIARDPNVKLERVTEDDKKMMTTVIFRSIHPKLRVVYVHQKDLLGNGFELWKALEDRFQAPDQQQLDVEAFLSMKQGSRPLHEFIIKYDNLRRKLGNDCLMKLMSEEAMIRHLHRAIAITSQSLFPHGVKSIEEVIKILLENANMFKEEQPLFHSALATQRPREDRSTPQRCYKCGQLGHLRGSCPNPLKCFRCNGTGHISRDCNHPKA